VLLKNCTYEHTPLLLLLLLLLGSVKLEESHTPPITVNIRTSVRAAAVAVATTAISEHH
jgi:hypothetical protein